MIDQNSDRIINALGVLMVGAILFGGFISIFPGVVASVTGFSGGYDVTYHMNGGYSEMERRAINVRGEHEVPTDEPEKDNHQFRGWLAINEELLSDNPDVSSYGQSDGTMYLPSARFEPDGNTYMIAQWIPR